MKEYTFVNILDVLITNDNILAHTKTGRQSETLAEHTARSILYFTRLSEGRNLRYIFNNFANTFFNKDNKPAIDLFNKMLSNIVVFHDFGKINPAFQTVCVNNPAFSGYSIECLNGSRHSILSATIYLDYFMNEIENSNLSSLEKYRLKYIAFLNSFIISRHHSDLSSKKVHQINDYINSFCEDREINAIISAMKEGKFSRLYKGPFYQKSISYKNLGSYKNKFYDNLDKEDYKNLSIYIFSYVKFMYSVLISCDYYATSEYDSNIEIKDYGIFNETNGIKNLYENSQIMKTIRKETNQYDDGKNINILRNAMFLECETNLMKNINKNIFYLEAPTGSGKSNMAINCSLKLLDDKIKRIIYVYPFNTLVEQNLNSLKKIFGKSNIMDKIAVINSITPIKGFKKAYENEKIEENNEFFYQKVLLDRQFLNYPFILTTHVNLFDIMFGCSKESSSSFYQLSGSVIVLDEIQSYKNVIWTEIMLFLQCFAEILNIKILIMSATLPKLDYLTGINHNLANLITDRKRYFEDKRFKNRVDVTFELLNSPLNFESLAEHVIENIGSDRNVLIEFITRKTAYEFFDYIKEKLHFENINVYCLTGDYNQIDRNRILSSISSSKGNILIATQVVEAGVDIDMDIGYKDISKLDSEEQFLGRINRNYKSPYGKVYFFNMDSAKRIYDGDLRIEKEFTITEPKMQSLLQNKDFDSYYNGILERINKSINSQLNEKGLDSFINDAINSLDFYNIKDRMKLIDDDDWTISVFISRNIILPDGNILCGNEIWEDYKRILSDNSMNYAEKQVKLFNIKSKFNYFVYKVNCNTDINYNDFIGEIYFIQDGEQYLQDGRLILDDMNLIL
ncbi:MAG: CRISPR-associated helicase Cas3' [Lachnospiraceae bacterium]|nr:CRISPR-associated helicase Cas3' [Lachnospiraceae bacterium]